MKKKLIFFSYCHLQIWTKQIWYLNNCNSYELQTWSGNSGKWEDNLVKIVKKYFTFFSSYCPLQILALKTCSQDISKTITASSFKLCQLIEANELIIWWKKKCFIFSSYCPLQILASKTCHQDVSKIILARSFKHGQLVEDDE